MSFFDSDNKNTDFKKTSSSDFLEMLGWKPHKDEYRKTFEEIDKQFQEKGRKPIHQVDTYGILGRLLGSKVI
jgi:hypothetical protein